MRKGGYAGVGIFLPLRRRPLGIPGPNESALPRPSVIGGCGGLWVGHWQWLPPLPNEQTNGGTEARAHLLVRPSVLPPVGPFGAQTGCLQCFPAKEKVSARVVAAAAAVAASMRRWEGGGEGEAEGLPS